MSAVGKLEAMEVINPLIIDAKRKDDLLERESVLSTNVRSKRQKTVNLDKEKLLELSQRLNVSFVGCSFTKPHVYHLKSLKFCILLKSPTHVCSERESFFNTIASEFNKMQLQPRIEFRRPLASFDFRQEQAIHLMEKHIRIVPPKNLLPIQESVLKILLNSKQLVLTFPNEEDGCVLTTQQKTRLIANAYFKIAIPNLSAQTLSALNCLQYLKNPFCPDPLNYLEHINQANALTLDNIEYDCQKLDMKGGIDNPIYDLSFFHRHPQSVYGFLLALDKEGNPSLIEALPSEPIICFSPQKTYNFALKTSSFKNQIPHKLFWIISSSCVQADIDKFLSRYWIDRSKNCENLHGSVVLVWMDL